MSQIKYYFDENITSVVAEALRQRGIDAITTPEAKNRSDNDMNQLVFAHS
jgi:hypothetical protein